MTDIDAVGGASPDEQDKNEKRSITGRFEKAEVKCGDAVGLWADAKNIPDGTPTRFLIKTISEDKIVQAVNDELKSSQVRSAKWISKKPTAIKDKPELYFRVLADKESAKSENELKFYHYKDQATEIKTIACTSGVFGWTGKFDIEFKAGRIIVTVKIRLINYLGSKPAPGGALPKVGPAVSAADNALMRRDIEAKLSGKWVLHRKDCKRGNRCDCRKSRKCCKFQVRIRVRFVESGEHHTVNLFQGSGRANASNWTRIKTRDNSWAHETGHLLGWYDEYTGGAVGVAPRWAAPRASAVMNTGLDIPKEYYQDFRDWFASKTSESWELIKP